MFNTNFAFKSGKLTVAMDMSAGSSGKGKLGAFLTEHANNWTFACNTFYPQAGHWVETDEGKRYFYQTFNSCAYQDKYEKMYIGPGSIIELPAFWREIKESNIDKTKIGIHPMVAILQDIDSAFERGEVDLDGNKTKQNDGTMKNGSTCHGVGAARARRILRKSNTLLARDIPELKSYLCDTTAEIKERLDRGESGLLEIAQGFQLSYLLNDFYPYCTSRNCTVAAGFDDMMLPTHYLGDVFANCRTYPIRISNYKYIGKDGTHLTWEDVQNGVPHTKYEGNSGPGYNDSYEVEWSEITAKSGSNEEIIELTSVTKLPRRAFSWSNENLIDFVKYNDPGPNNKIYLSINFVNYIDAELFGKRGLASNMGEKWDNWMKDSGFSDLLQGPIGNKITLSLYGTGPKTDDMLMIEPMPTVTGMNF